MEKTEDAARPERILPTEDGYWWDARYDHPIAVVDFGENRGGGSELTGLMGNELGSYLPVSHPSWQWQCAIPAPEQLAAMEAQLAAGQALADHLRLRAAAARQHGCCAIACEFDDPLLTEHLAAFPPSGALPGPSSVPPAEEPPSPQIVDLAAALRASLDRKGGAR